MARGNDSADAARELRERYNTTGNAEDLIAASRAKRSGLVRTASLQVPDDEATRKLDAAKVKSKVGTDNDIVSFQVRGDTLLYVEKLPDGRTRKAAKPLGGKDEQERGDAGYEQLAAEAHAAAVAREAEAKAQAEAQEAAAKKLEAGRKEAEKEAAKARDEAAKEAEKRAEAERKAAESGSGS